MSDGYLRPEWGDWEEIDGELEYQKGKDSSNWHRQRFRLKDGKAIATVSKTYYDGDVFFTLREFESHGDDWANNIMLLDKINEFYSEAADYTCQVKLSGEYYCDFKKLKEAL